jgi:[ribosomal protein S5]-alanine N-acetyltransferase
MNVQSLFAPTFTTERLTLRARTPSDLSTVFDYFNDEEVRKFLGGHPPSRPDEIARMCLKSYHDPGFWTIALTNTSQVIGEISFVSIIFVSIIDEYLGEIGYLIASPFWNCGYATEAARKVIAHGFKRLGLARIRARMMVSNTGSVRVAEKLGMAYETRLNDGDFGGKVADIFHYSISCDQFCPSL